MSEVNEQRLTVEIEGTGQQYTTNIESYHLSSDWTVPTDGWDFVAFSEEDPASLRRIFRPLQLVTLYINGQTQIRGRIDRIQGTGESGKALLVQGRDYTSDMQGGGADPKLQLKKDMTLDAALFKIFAPWSVDTLLGNFNPVRNLLTGRNVFSGAPARDFKTAKVTDFDVKNNQGAWELAMDIVARHGYTIQQAGQRNALAIVAPEYGQEPSFKLKRPGNVLTADASQDYSKVPTVTVARGRGGSPTSGKPAIGLEVSTFTKNAPSAIGQTNAVQRVISDEAGLFMVRDTRWKPGGNTIFANDYPLYRPMYYQDKQSRTQEQLERGLRREVAERLRDTLVYSCTVRGHEDPATGTVYAVDTIADVLDTVEDIEEPLWVLSREFVNDGEGPLTRLTLVRPESYVL